MSKFENRVTRVENIDLHTQLVTIQTEKGLQRYIGKGLTWNKYPHGEECSFATSERIQEMVRRYKVQQTAKSRGDL